MRLYASVYEFRPLSEEVKAVCLSARRRFTGLQYMCVFYRGCKPLSQRRGVAYIECARTPAIPRYRGYNVHKEWALLITLAIKCY